MINCRFVGALGVVSLVVSVVLPAIVVVVVVMPHTHTLVYTHICTLHCHEQSQRLFGNCLTVVVVPCLCLSLLF